MRHFPRHFLIKLRIKNPEEHWNTSVNLQQEQWVGMNSDLRKLPVLDTS